MTEHPIKGLMETAMQSIKEMVDVNTIVGDTVEAGDGTVLVPISKVAFGFGAGGSEFGKNEGDSTAKFGGGSGGGVSIEPVAFMVVGQGQIKLIPVDKQATPAQEIIEQVPSMLGKIVDSFKGNEKKKKNKEDKEKIETIETIEVASE